MARTSFPPPPSPRTLLNQRLHLRNEDTSHGLRDLDNTNALSPSIDGQDGIRRTGNRKLIHSRWVVSPGGLFAQCHTSSAKVPDSLNSAD